MLRAVLHYRGVALPKYFAWTYTHHTGEWVEPWRQRMHELGLYIRRSDYFGPGGAIVWPFEDIATARAKAHAKVAKCPAQLRDTTCAECRLCWERPDLTIAFDPHGATAKRVRAAATAAV